MAISVRSVAFPVLFKNLLTNLFLVLADSGSWLRYSWDNYLMVIYRSYVRYQKIIKATRRLLIKWKTGFDFLKDNLLMDAIDFQFWKVNTFQNAGTLVINDLLRDSVSWEYTHFYVLIHISTNIYIQIQFRVDVKSTLAFRYLFMFSQECSPRSWLFKGG